MTIERFQEMDCPKCGSKQTEKVWDSINVTLNPELKENLFKGQINKFNCKNCGEEASILLPFMYHDMEKLFCVQFYPFNWLNYDQSLEHFTKEGDINFPSQIGKIADYMKRTHIVFEMGELVRYVIFRDKLSGKWEKVS